MATIRKTHEGIEYLFDVLKEKANTITQVNFWKIPHKTTQGDIRLKLGRYNKGESGPDSLEVANPKSELTLDNEEFQQLLKFLGDNYEPFKKSVREYIPLDETFGREKIGLLRALFNNPDKNELLSFIATNDILPADILAALQIQARGRAVQEFDDMLRRNLVEYQWQEWFRQNAWVLGSEFVRVLDEREIDPRHIGDYLMQAYDGFLDIVEIKRPDGEMKFWADKQDHGNWVPATDLVKAISQSTRYIYEVEREANSVKFLERVGNVKTIKPRCVLIFGRSHEWSGQQKEAYRILNASYHNLMILTYDHVLDRAKRILGLSRGGN